MHFTHIPATDPVRAGRTGAHHVWSDIRLGGDHIDRHRIRHTYRTLRNHGLTPTAARVAIWNVALACIASRPTTGDHDLRYS